MSSHRSASRARSFSSDPEFEAIPTLGRRVSCDRTALELIGLPEEFLEVVCEDLPPRRAVGLESGSRRGMASLRDVVAVLEDPDLRPYLWDLEVLPCR